MADNPNGQADIPDGMKHSISLKCKIYPKP